MKTSESLLSVGKFIAEYSAHLMGAGVHTSRVVRNSNSIGEVCTPAPIKWGPEYILHE